MLKPLLCVILALCIVIIYSEGELKTLSLMRAIEGEDLENCEYSQTSAYRHKLQLHLGPELSYFQFIN